MTRVSHETIEEPNIVIVVQMVGGEQQTIGGDQEMIETFEAMIGGEQQMMGDAVPIHAAFEAMIGGKQQMSGDAVSIGAAFAGTDEVDAPIITASEALIAGCVPPVIASEALIAGCVPLVAASEALIAGCVPLVAASEALIAGRVPLVAASEALIAGRESLVIASEALVASRESLVAASESVAGKVTHRVSRRLWRRDSKRLCRPVVHAGSVRHAAGARRVVRTDGRGAEPGRDAAPASLYGRRPQRLGVVERESYQARETRFSRPPLGAFIKPPALRAVADCARL